jgi:hypothetical protein
MIFDRRLADATRIRWALDHERERPLAPFVILDADDGGFGYSRALRDQILDLKR